VDGAGRERRLSFRFLFHLSNPSGLDSRMVIPMKGLEEKEETNWPREVAAQLPETKVSAKARNCLKLGSMPVLCTEWSLLLGGGVRGRMNRIEGFAFLSNQQPLDSFCQTHPSIDAHTVQPNYPHRTTPHSTTQHNTTRTGHPVDERDEEEGAIAHGGVGDEAREEVGPDGVGPGEVLPDDDGPVEGEAHHDGKRRREHVGDHHWGAGAAAGLVGLGGCGRG
jgi:hypothetical protein